MYVSGRVDIFDMVDIDLFTVIMLNMMVLKLGYTSKFEPMFYNYLRPLTSLDEGWYDLACEEDVHCLATLIRSFKLIEVYIEHGVTILDSYLRAPRFRATLKEISDEPGSIAANRTKKMLLLSWHESSGTPKEPVCDSGVDTESHILLTIQSQFSGINLSFVSQQATASQVIDDVIGSGLRHDESFRVDDLDLNLNEPVNLKMLALREDAEQYNGEFDESTCSDGEFFFDDEGIDTEYDIQSSEDVEPDVDVHLFGINMDLPFDNISVTNLVLDDVLEGEDVDVINADGFDSDPGNDEETHYKKRRVYLHSIESIRNLKLYKNDGVRIRARCDAKVLVFTMSQGTVPTNLNRRMEAGPSGSSGPTTRSKKRKNTDAHDKWGSLPLGLVCGKRQIYKKLGGEDIQRYTYAFNLGKSNTSLTNSCLRRYLNKSGLIWISQLRQFKTSSNYSMLRDYVVESKSTNPNTTIKIAVERNTDPSLPTKVFQRIYVCLRALKLGFRACRRDLLVLDSAFMKGPFRGQVLVAVGLDSNNGIYPLAYALVEAESKSSSDRQKGIIPAIKTVYPVYPIASATNVMDFEKCMLKLKTINPKAHEWLNKIPAKHWAISHFSGKAKSDLLLNNICEVFNGKIVRGRDKLVITLLEYIREYCMKRIVNVKGVIYKCTGPLTPNATRIMESIKKEAHLIKVRWNRANKYQVSACWNMALNDQAAPPPRFVGGNNAEASGSASRQVQQTDPVVGQDGSGGLGDGVIIGLSVAASEGGPSGAGVDSQGMSGIRGGSRLRYEVRGSLAGLGGSKVGSGHLNQQRMI
ncbi:hypothetical protein Tco_0896330 [Tanacetum coccineum]